MYVQAGLAAYGAFAVMAVCTIFVAIGVARGKGYQLPLALVILCMAVVGMSAMVYSASVPESVLQARETETETETETKAEAETTRFATPELTEEPETSLDWAAYIGTVRTELRESGITEVDTADDNGTMIVTMWDSWNISALEESVASGVRPEGWDNALEGWRSISETAVKKAQDLGFADKHVKVSFVSANDMDLVYATAIDGAVVYDVFADQAAAVVANPEQTARPVTTVEADWRQGGYLIINTETGVYHDDPNCMSLRNSDDSSYIKATDNTARELLEAGYSPCGICCK